MLRYISKRLLLLFPTLLGVVTIVFFMMSFAPGDPARLALGARATPEAVEALRSELGLDQPIWVQYTRYLKKVVVLDFGKSIKTGEPVVNELFARFPATIELALVSITISTVLGILIGVISAARQYSFIDLGAMLSALIGVSMPVFWLALVLIMVFSVGFDLFPTGGRMNMRYFFDPITGFYLIDARFICAARRFSGIALAWHFSDAVRDVIDRIESGHVLILQEEGRMAFPFGEYRHQHIGAGDLLAAR